MVSMLSLTVLLIGRSIKESLKVIKVGKLDLSDPALALRVLVEEGGVAGEGGVGLDDLHVGGGIDVAHRLDTLDDAGGLALLLGGADGGGLDVDEVAEGLLGIVADAELGNAVAFGLDVLVRLGITSPGEGVTELDVGKNRSGLECGKHFFEDCIYFFLRFRKEREVCMHYVLEERLGEGE